MSDSRKSSLESSLEDSNRRISGEDKLDSHRSSRSDLEEGRSASVTTSLPHSPCQQYSAQPTKEEAAPSNCKRKLDWASPEDPENPHNWPFARKALHTFIPTASAFVCTLASSIITPGRADIQEEFQVSAEVSLLPYVLYVLGLAAGPVLAGPCSETFGRRVFYWTSIPLFALFILGAGFSQSIASLTICRFFAGFFGSPALTIGAATLSDIWKPSERAVPVAIYITTPFLGPAVGPLVGGFATLGTGWRWTQWTILFFTVAALLPALGMKETYKPAILRRSAIKNGTAMRQSMLQASQSLSAKVLTRSIHMAIVEPVVGLFTLYIALNFGMVYAFFAAFPYVFEEAYGFGVGSTGLTFIGLGVGSLIGCAIILLFSQLVFRPEVARSHRQGHGGKIPPEKRLYLAMIGSVCLPTSLFWFGWSVHAGAHWICPVIAEAVFGCGNLLIFMATIMYIVDFYGPQYAASANAANGIARYLLAAVFPLFIVQMYSSLGVGWATSVLAFISLALMPIPWVFYRMGPELRRRSRYVE